MRDSMLDEPAAYLFRVAQMPTYTAEEFEPMLRLLSLRFTGEVWSCGSYEADILIGRMRLRVVKMRFRSRISNFIPFARAVMRRARQLRAAPPAQRLVITSYDLVGGLLAWRVARLLGGAFICEVNNSFGNPDNFAHVKSAVRARLLQLRTRLLGSFVLGKADAVKLLFDGQLDGFVTLHPNTITRRFHDITFIDRFHEGPEEPIILSAGFPFETKGMDLLVSAFTRIAAEFPGWRLVLIGHRVPQALQAYGLEHEQITALPGITQSQFTQWVSRCAIFALTSRSEGIPRVLLEAAAAGKCRIATRVGGIPMIIEDGKDGLLVDKGNIDDLAAGLRALISDEQLRRRLAGEGQRRVARDFSEAAYLEHFEEMITATLQTSNLYTYGAIGNAQ